MDPAFNYAQAMQKVLGLLQRQRATATTPQQMSEYQRQSNDAMRQMRQSNGAAPPIIESAAGFDNAQAQATGALPKPAAQPGIVQRVAGASNLFGVTGDAGTAGAPGAAKIETPKLAASTGLIRRKM